MRCRLLDQGRAQGYTLLVKNGTSGVARCYTNAKPQGPKVLRLMVVAESRPIRPKTLHLKHSRSTCKYVPDYSSSKHFTWRCQPFARNATVDELFHAIEVALEDFSIITRNRLAPNDPGLGSHSRSQETAKSFRYEILSNLGTISLWMDMGLSDHGCSLEMETTPQREPLSD